MVLKGPGNSGLGWKGPWIDGKGPDSQGGPYRVSCTGALKGLVTPLDVGKSKEDCIKIVPSN